jgi:hypothetical protein
MRIWLIMRIVPRTLGGPSAEEATKERQLIFSGNDSYTHPGGVQPSRPIRVYLRFW